jgi:aldose sugar dehydrogenase
VKLNSKFIPGSALLALFVLACFYSSGSLSASKSLSESAVPKSGSPTRPLREVIAKLPLSFEQNLGQVNARAQFVARGGTYNLVLTANGALLEPRPVISEGDRDHEVVRHSRRRLADSVLRLRLVAANLNAIPQGVDELSGKRNYLLGNDPKKWHTDVPTFRAVRYDNVYSGIDLTYYGNQQHLEYDFEVEPGADPRKIRIAFSSAARPRISANGDLVLRTATGELTQLRPVIYQQIDGQRRAVEGRYLLDKQQVGFEIGPYDRSRALVIDPTLVYATYLGGSGDDLGSSIAVDSNNNIYIAGTTSSANFPSHNGAFGTNAGLADIFVTKIDAAGANIIYSTYVGGSGLDRGDGLTIDNSGNAYVVGRVDSSSTNFPATTGSFGPSYRGGDFDGVVFKLNPQGNGLVYAGFLGGEENDSTEGVAVDASGVAYVTGGTKSVAFPTTGNGYQTNRGGDTDAYLAKINAAGSALLYSTYLGGSGTDRGSGVAIDGNGNAYLAGFAGSADFPTENAFQNDFGGGFDAFVAQIDTKQSGLDSLVLCSYLGGIGDDKAYGIAIDSTATNIYVAGQTSSNNFPLLNPAQPGFGGSFDAFVAKITTAGVKVYASYIGGSGDDRGTGVAVNQAGAAYVTGFTSSANFPIASALQSTKGGGSDAFLTKLDAAGSSFLYSTYLGGTGNESSVSTVTSTNPICLDSTSNVYLTGYTASPNFPTMSPLQGTNAGGASDGFVVKISDAAPAADYAVSVSPASQTVNPGNNTTFTVTATPTGGFTGNVNLSVTGLSADASGAFNPSPLHITDATPKSSLLTITTTAATPPGSYPLSITTTSGNLQHSAPSSLVVAGPTSANLSITKTASPNPAIVGASLTYRIIIANSGPSPATNVTMTDPLPSGATFVSAIPTQGSCSGSNTVSCNFGSVPNDGSATATVTIVPLATGSLSNTATVTATETDPDPSNNSSSIVTPVTTQSNGPSMLDPNLSVKTLVTGLSQPTSLAFIGPNDFFVLEKDTGKVQRIVNGSLQSTVLDLAVNSGSERGLLGIVLHPDFNINGYVYLYWTESSTGIDSTNLADVVLLGNRVDRYVWNGSTLTFDRNLIKLHAFQADANQTLRGNHNGGVLRFGPDGKLYIMMGDNGRRGLLQNNQLGPVPDDQFGGPEPDNAHLTGFILRLNDDGSTPVDNPFFNASTTLTGEAAANIKKLFAYGVRNGFGLAFDPLSGNLWDQENGDDAYDEMNRITAGSNNGWVETMGPLSRVTDYKQIESTYGAGNLQQLRWPPSLIADTPAIALTRLYMLPGAHYNDPEFSWKYPTPAAPLGFVQGRGLGPQFEGDMFVGAARTFLDGGFLFRFKLTPDRLHFSLTDPRLADLVADNLDKFDITESESLLIGKDFGITTDIQTGPNGDLFVVSNTNSAVYEISGKQPTVFVASLTASQEVPPTNSTATGTATLLLSPDETTARLSLNFSGLTSPESVAHIHGPGAPGVIAPVLFPLPNGNLSDFLIALAPSDVQNLKDGLLYINVHSNNFGNGEIRGQFQSSATAASLQFSAASYMTTESAGGATITVTRLGDTSREVTVNYGTTDGTANQRNDYITASGNLHFSAGETVKTFTVPIVDDVYQDGSKTINLVLSNPQQITDGFGKAFLGSPSNAVLTITDNDAAAPAANPLDDPQFFTNQQYLDFLNREPDLGGLAYWTNEISKCGADQACTRAQRINVSAAFFIEAEFQQTGSYAYRLYKGALGRDPNYAEFSLDRSVIIGGPDLGVNKNNLLFSFVGTPEFLSKYPTGTDFVGALLQTAHNSSGADLTALESGLRQTYSTCLAGNTTQVCNAAIVDQLINSPAFSQAVYNPSFVLMQYFGYLRRDPDPNGYAFWLDVLTNREPNNYHGLVCAFITSAEYQQRFSSVVTHSNSECAGVH